MMFGILSWQSKEVVCGIEMENEETRLCVGKKEEE